MYDVEHWKFTDTKFKADFKKLEVLVHIFESDVRDLLGPKCRYQMGRDGPYFDLLIWSIMMSRKDLSDYLWRRCDKPIHSALTACILYRKMAKQAGLEPKQRLRMKEGGALFETYAIGVVKLASVENFTSAMDVLEEKIAMWEGITAVDVAVDGECEDFMEECLAEAIERRFRGDLDTYSQKFWIFDSFLSVIVLCTLSLGFLAPSVVNWNVPPVAENIRFNSQRRKAPKGYPFDVQLSDQHKEAVTQAQEFITQYDRQMQQTKAADSAAPPSKLKHGASFRGHPETKQARKASVIVVEGVEFNDTDGIPALSKVANIVKRLLRDPRKAKDMSPAEINTLWAPTWGWLDKFLLFWSTPVVLFLANSIIQMTLTTAFTWFLVNTYPSDDKIYPYEHVMLVYFSAYLLVECFQLAFAGLSYFTEFWNLLDLLSSGCFLAGFIIRSEYADAKGFLWRDSVKAEHAWMLLYSITACGLWTRLLRMLSVEKRMGILVITIQAMFVDILRFGIIWLMLWMAFAILMRGSALEESQWNFDYASCGLSDASLDDAALDDAVRRASRTPTEDEEGKEGMSCWPSWWLLKLFFQSMGEFYNDDIRTDAEMITLMLMFVVMNIMLLNLLIAIMSNSFTEIQEQANRKYLMAMHDLSREVSRLALAVPAPLNLPFLLVELLHFAHLEANSRSKLVYGLESWLDRLQVHFGRNVSTTVRFNRVVYDKYLAWKKKERSMETMTKKDQDKLETWFKALDGSPDVKDELKRQRRQEEKTESLRDAFVERCRTKFMQEYKEEQGKDDEIQHLETKLLKSIEEVEDRLMDRLYELPDKHGAGTSTLSPSHGQQNIAV